jgi:hypothetical protein
MHPSCRCRTAVLSGGAHDVVPFHTAVPNNPRYIPFADSAPQACRPWCRGTGVNGGVRCYFACWLAFLLGSR